jgi:hypothetical protein
MSGKKHMLVLYKEYEHLIYQNKNIYRGDVNGEYWIGNTIRYRAVRCVRAPKGSVVNFTAYQNVID